MDDMMMYGKNIPAYYDTMYLDGYTPYEILYATHKKKYQERQAAAQRAKQEAERDTIIPTINFSSTVKVRK